MSQPPTDQELIARARDGDAEAYAALVREHWDAASRTALQITGSSVEAEDATQEGFVKAYAALARFHDGEPLRPWLLTIVANEARNRRKSAHRRERLAAQVTLEATAGGNGGEPSPEEAALSAEQRELVLAALGSLRAEDREVIAYRHLLDYSERETAAALGWPRGTVKSRLSRALARLRAELGDKLAISLPLAAAAAAALLAVSPGARSAIRDLLGLQGAQIERGEPGAVSPAPPALGEPVSLAQAQRRARFEILLPRTPELGPPQRIGFDRDAAPGGQVTLVWKRRARPVLLLTQVVGTRGPIVGKVAPASTRIEPVQLDGRPGYWLSGAPHQVSYLRQPARRLAGDVLLWERGSLLLRLEGAAPKHAALRIARSVR